MTLEKEYTLTAEEIEACIKLVNEMREEARRQERIQHCKHSISSMIADSISQIGLNETKRIVREISRELRALKVE